MPRPLVTIIINNYNYGRFLGPAIQSVLDQDYSPAEIVVVDDGSTDNSREIISKYIGSSRAVFKENGGQASALNAGVAASRGDILCLLDADDCFRQGKVKRIVEAFENHGLNSKPLLVHHQLQIINTVGESVSGQLMGNVHKSPLNLYKYAKAYRSILYAGAPTSGLCINRCLARKLFPLPHKGIVTSADDFVVKGASLVGELYSLPEVLGSYREHGSNLWHGSNKGKSAEFIRTLDAFLNEKLAEAGRLPVLDFEDSMHAWGNLLADRKWSRLFTQIVKLSVRQHDYQTACYVLSTLRGAASVAAKRALSKTGF